MSHIAFKIAYRCCNIQVRNNDIAFQFEFFLFFVVPSLCTCVLSAHYPKYKTKSNADLMPLLAQLL